LKVRILEARLINERLYKKGDEEDFNDELAIQLIKQGLAEEIKPKTKTKKDKKEPMEVSLNG